MGLINKTILMRWNPSNKKYYESKGYIYTKMKDKFEIKIEDLIDNSKFKINVECDGCGKILKNITWQDYKRIVKEDHKYYCQKCAHNGYKKYISFEEWCISNEKEDVLNRWDYELNELKPEEISYGTQKKYYFKCPRGIHTSELKNISSFTNSSRKGSMNCNQCNSFKQWCIDNNRQDVLDRWDYDLNDCKPSEISYGNSKKYYFKCPKELHESGLKNISSFTSGQEGTMVCKQCGSIAHWGINNICEDFLEKYWDYDKNKIDPWQVSYSNAKKIYIKCQEKDYHGSYDIACCNFVTGNRCGYCANHKIHPLDSLGKLLEDKGLLHIWSDKNNKSPYEYAPVSGKEVYWKCPDDGKHEDYLRKISDSNTCGFRCPECGYSKGEDRISSNLTNKGFIKISQEEFDQLINQDKYNNNYYIPQMKYEGLVGLGNGLLSYDFCIPKYNLLIEYDGEFHYKPIKKYKNEPIKYAEERFRKQQEHDRRKNEYAKINNINLLRIPYYDFDNIEQILTDYLINCKYKLHI